MSELKDIKILIVEDNPIIAEDLRSFLESESFRIEGVAHNAVDALDALSSRNVNFAILDIHLGTGQNGLDIAEVIHEKYKIPYIFLTSFDDDATLEEAQKHAPYGYLIKPFQERTVLTTIKLAIGNHRHFQESDKLDLSIIKAKASSELSEQEVKIIEDLLVGSSYKQIAGNLFISINTVKYHAKNIYLKLNIKGRAELSALIR